MKRIQIMMTLTLIMLLNIVSIKAQELTPTVTFDGTVSLKYNIDTKEFGKTFENMVPSEKRTLNILLKNDSHQDVDFFMSTEVLEAFEDAKQASHGSYHVSLSVFNNGETTYVYGDKIGALVGSNENGLYDLNGSLNQKYKIAHILANQDATIQLTVELDGTTLRNEYQGLPGMFAFDFTAQYDNAVKSPQTIIKTIIRNVQTGDSTTIEFLILSMMIVGSGGLLILRKGGHKNDK